MKNTIYYLIFICIIATQTQCVAQDKTEEIKSEAYEPCCGVGDAVSLDIDGLKVFVPNVFTPNGDGVNDLFYPIFNSSFDKAPWVGRFAIFNDSTDQRRIIWSTPVGLDLNNLDNTAFNGVNYNFTENGNPEEWRGSFYYFFDIYVGNQLHIISGMACVIRCDEEAKIFIDKEGCFFPSQVTAQFSGDNDLPKGEKGCFE